MSLWREETAADLAEATRAIEALVPGVSGDLTKGQKGLLWAAYLKVEKSVAFIRFDIDEENPGRFIKLRTYSTPDERQSLTFALKHLKKGRESFALGDFVQALKDLRESRNYLRALIREARLKETRKARSG